MEISGIEKPGSLARLVMSSYPFHPRQSEWSATAIKYDK